MTIEAVDTEDGAIRDIEQTRDALREQARATLGVVGDERTAPLRELVRRHGLSYYPMIALGLLTMTDSFQAYAFTVYIEDIAAPDEMSIRYVIE